MVAVNQAVAVPREASNRRNLVGGLLKQLRIVQEIDAEGLIDELIQANGARSGAPS
jgi:hypothetical protein